jgi:hypothetical protein
MTFEEFKNWDIRLKKQETKPKQLSSPHLEELLNSVYATMGNLENYRKAPLLNQGCRSFVPSIEAWNKAMKIHNNAEEAATVYFNAKIIRE